MNISRSISQLRETICTSKGLTCIETTLYQNDFVSKRLVSKRLVSKQLYNKTTVVTPCEKQLQSSKLYIAKELALSGGNFVRLRRNLPILKVKVD